MGKIVKHQALNRVDPKWGHPELVKEGYYTFPEGGPVVFLRDEAQKSREQRISA